jgi:tripartite-type tricarboxylate transporter receptor subunit TctC
MTDVLGGQMQMTIEALTTAVPHIQVDRVCALAVTSPERIADIPDVPTMLEQGYREFPAASWTGVLAPAGTGAAIVGKINAVINAGLAAPEIKASFAKFSAQAKIGSPQDFAAFIAAEAPRWAALVRASGAKME